MSVLDCADLRISWCLESVFAFPGDLGELGGNCNRLCQGSQGETFQQLSCLQALIASKPLRLSPEKPGATAWNRSAAAREQTAPLGKLGRAILPCSGCFQPASLFVVIPPVQIYALMGISLEIRSKNGN